jgi:hypothetical protein
MITVPSLINEARQWIGVPFRHQGRSKYGVDCIGLIICVRNAIEPWPVGMGETTNYSRVAVDTVLVDKIREHGFEPIPRAVPGCIILIKWPKVHAPSHIALCLGETMVHAYRRVNKVCEVGYRQPWNRMTAGFFKIPGVCYE